MVKKKAAKKKTAKKKAKKKKPIENYNHRDKERLNNPPVGLVTPDTDKDGAKKKSVKRKVLDEEMPRGFPSNEDLILLLLFKDQVPDKRVKGFPLVTKSLTVERHLEVLTKKMPHQLSFDFQEQEDVETSRFKMPEVKDITADCCVWGWWRKSWEQNDELLEVFSQKCREGMRKPTAILYNQYLRRAYLATLYDVYFYPNARSVEVPPKWADKCPEYYSKQPHMCGAFFALRIQGRTDSDRDDYDPSELFKDYRVDELSFPILKDDFESVISVPEGIEMLCINLVDETPSAQALKWSEHTMFALRKRSRKEITRQLLTGNATDEDLATAFKSTALGDIKEILLSSDVAEWKMLIKKPKTIEAIAEASGNTILHFDILLVTWAISSDQLREGLVPSGEKHQRDTKDFCQCLVKWLIEDEVRKKRQDGAKLYALIWRFIKERYKLADLSKYFESLPNMEEIAYSTQYGIKHKFYRDHLNHNIRAALLGGYLADQLFSSKRGNFNKILVAFLAGLLHDIAHPLASYEKVGRAIEDALALLKLPIVSRVQSLVERNEKMQENLCIVGLLSSVKGLEQKQKEHKLLPWKNRKEIIEMGEPRILFEEMACAMCDDHALLSAAVLLNAAFYPGDGEPSSDRMKDVFREGSADKAKDSGLEFLNLIQSVALHDRAGAARSHGMREEQLGGLAPLNLLDFPLATLTVIADDLQEWGRPIADFAMTLVTDCSISVGENEIIAEYEIQIEPSVIGDTPYSFLEHFLAKVRNLYRLETKKEEHFSVDITANISGKLEVIDCGITDAVLTFNNEDLLQVIWPWREDDIRGDIKLTETRKFLRLGYRNGQGSLVTRDFIVLNIDNNLQESLKGLEHGDELISMKVKNLTVTIETESYKIEGEIAKYYFTQLKEEATVVNGNEDVNFKDRIGIMEIEVKNITPKQREIRMLKGQKKDLHLVPCPHFLDLDWRFSFDAVTEILRFVKKHCKNGKVCYLGCPTLALYHQVSEDIIGDIEYTLFDRGHHGIRVWCSKGLIDKNKVVYRDVHDTLPIGMEHKYDMVIMDAPWYKHHYKVFWQRALGLVKPDGLIGVAEYPGYDLDKLDELEDLRQKIVRKIGDKDFFASINISYSPPVFEEFWKKDREFQHTAFSTYRPAYMDFYQIENPPSHQREVGNDYEECLPKVIELKNGHYLRCREDIDAILKDKKKVTLKTRRSLKIVNRVSEKIIAWSTGNTLVKIDERKQHLKIVNEKELAQKVMQWEDANRAT